MSAKVSTAAFNRWLETPVARGLTVNQRRFLEHFRRMQKQNGVVDPFARLEDGSTLNGMAAMGHLLGVKRDSASNISLALLKLELIARVGPPARVGRSQTWLLLAGRTSADGALPETGQTSADGALPAGEPDGALPSADGALQNGAPPRLSLIHI